MIRKRLFFIVLGIALVCSLSAQQKRWSIRSNAGLSSGGSAEGHKWFEGYYFSFDVGVPLFKGFEIVPTFTYATMLPNYKMDIKWLEAEDAPIIDVQGNKPRDNKTSEFGENLSSVSLLLFFKPFDYIKNEKFKRHQVILGGGYSYTSYTMVRTEFQNSYNTNLKMFGFESRRAFQPYYGKVGYNYLIKGYIIIGATGSLIGIKKDEAQFLLGFQFGVRF